MNLGNKKRNKRNQIVNNIKKNSMTFGDMESLGPGSKKNNKIMQYGLHAKN